jgi:O-antigen/teichoic acid export membrane protein
VSSRAARAAAGTVTGAAQYLVQLVGMLILTPVILRFAGREVLGAYAAIAQAIGYLALLDFGFSVVTARYLAQAAGAEDDWRRFGHVLSLSRTAILLSNLLFALCCVPLALWAGPLFSLSAGVTEQARTGLLVLAAWGLVRTPVMAFHGALVATQDIAATNAIFMVGTAVRLAGSLALVVAGQGLVGVLVANIIGEASTFGAQALLFRRRYPQVRLSWGVPNGPLFREMLGLSGQALLINIAVRLVFYTDNLVVGYLFGAVASGVYYTTQQPAFAGCNIIWKVADSSGPALNELVARGRLDRVRAAYCAVLRLSLIGGLALALGLVAFNRAVIGVWVGAEQYAGGLMTASLAAFAVLQVINHLNGGVLLAFGEIRWLSLTALPAGLANLGLSLWLGRRFGLQWVMVASVLVDLPGFPYFFHRCLKRLDLPVGELFARSIRPAMLACGPCLLLAGVLAGIRPELAPAPLALLIVLFLALLAFGSWTMGLLGEERAMAVGWWQKAVSRRGQT